ncbi:LysR family transcriptional regulator [Burkholderia ubonensis]|uniref:LysR family transcriptional regulator n=1 Tax=Burkholderia ubonensis TaxID=101571 RepID=UPI000A40D0AE
MKITLDELQAFTAVVDTESITAAAQQLDLTVSATSRTLARLEEKLKTTLLRRTTRRLELTEEGRAFLQDARAIIESVETAEEQMLARREMPSGRLRVDAATPFMLHVIVPLVRGYRERFPKVELELNSNEGIIDLLERRTDVAIRIGRLKDSTLHSRRIGDSRLRTLLAWNTMHMQQAVDRIEAVGQTPILPEYLRRIAPTYLEGINLRGTFDFPVADFADRLMPSLAVSAPADSQRARV